MTIRRRRVEPSLTPVERYVLEHGTAGAFEAGHDPIEALRIRRQHAERLWAEWRGGILTAWMAEHPGSRPWAWWKFDATESRSVVRGSPLLARGPDWIVNRWRDKFGEPMFVQVRPRGAALPLIESEAAYLQRLGLFALGERAECAEEAFQPEEVNPF